MVDILEWQGNGACGCADFAFRILPFREKGTTPPKRYCRHIAAARMAFVDEVIQRMLALEAK